VFDRVAHEGFSCKEACLPVGRPQSYEIGAVQKIRTRLKVHPDFRTTSLPGQIQIVFFLRDQPNFPFFSQCLSHGLAILLMDICLASGFI